MVMTSRNLIEEIPIGNQLLAVLSASAMHDLRADIKGVTLQRGALIYDVGDSIDNLFFPRSGLLQSSIPMSHGPAVPVITIGCEGMVGLPAILGAKRSLSRVTVAGGGTCVQLSLRALPRLAQHESVRRMLQRYMVASIGCFFQQYACSREHEAIQRCASQLLLASDRTGGSEFVLTQEFLGSILGLRRVNVGMAAQQLQRMGCIEYVRGHIKVRDRTCLEAVACECYRVARKYLDGVRE